MGDDGSDDTDDGMPELYPLTDDTWGEDPHQGRTMLSWGGVMRELRVCSPDPETQSLGERTGLASDAHLAREAQEYELSFDVTAGNSVTAGDAALAAGLQRAEHASCDHLAKDEALAHELACVDNSCFQPASRPPCSSDGDEELPPPLGTDSANAFSEDDDDDAITPTVRRLGSPT